MSTRKTPPTLRHFRLDIQAGNVLRLDFDHADSAINRLSAEVLAELAQVLDYTVHAPPAAMIIASSKPSGFIAGADIDSFSLVHTPEEARALVARGWDLFQRLAAVSFPTLALIRGHCLGGGLELSMACRYRLVVDQPDTRLALPEVSLGIFPAWGGVHRLPRLVGAPAALDLMLSGRTLNARRAWQLGLADAIAPPRLADQAATQLVTSRRPRRHLPLWQSVLNHPSIRPLLAKQALKKLRTKDPQGHYPATRTLLDVWARYDGNPLVAPDSIHHLLQSDTAKNLLRVYHLQERLKALGRAPGGKDMHHVHVIGAGVMGGDIAAWCVLRGLTVTLQDQNRSRIAQAQGRAQGLFNKKLDKRAARLAGDRLIPDPQGQGVARADVVIEAIFENLNAKRALYQQIETQLKPGALLATNTSSLSLSDLCAELQDPQRLIGLHFFNPVARMPLVEVVHTPDTPEDTRARALAFVGRIGKLPLPVQDTPGFLVNAVLAPYMLEAMRCVDSGTKPETLDAALVAFGMPMGPIELIDTVGLDIARDAGAQLSGHAPMPACLETRLARKDLGRKTGRGFYTWKKGRAVKQAPDAIPVDLAQRLIQPLIAKTRAQCDAGVVADADLADAGVIFGTGFAPFTGGPLHFDDKLNSQTTPISEAIP